jgi:hypothetical protein
MAYHATEQLAGGAASAPASGYTENAIVLHGVLETSVAFISKPFRIKTLLEKIREIFPEGRQP